MNVCKLLVKNVNLKIAGYLKSLLVFFHYLNDGGCDNDDQQHHHNDKVDPERDQDILPRPVNEAAKFQNQKDDLNHTSQSDAATGTAVLFLAHIAHQNRSKMLSP